MAIYALSTALYERLRPEEALDRIVSAGFREIEIAAEDPSAWFRDPAATRRAVEARGLHARTLHTPDAGWDVASTDEAARRAALQVARNSMTIAAELGVEIVISHPNKPPEKDYTPDEYRAQWARSREALALLAEHARTVGVRMAVENLPARGKLRPSSTIADVLRLIDGLGAHVGVCLDAGHSTANGQSAAQEALEAGGRLFALHIQDNDGQGGDQHWLPGRGVTDWDAFLSALDTMSFRGARTLEVVRGDEPDALLRALAALRQAWEAL